MNWCNNLSACFVMESFISHSNATNASKYTVVNAFLCKIKLPENSGALRNVDQRRRIVLNFQKLR